MKNRRCERCNYDISEYMRGLVLCAACDEEDY